MRCDFVVSTESGAHVAAEEATTTTSSSSSSSSSKRTTTRFVVECKQVVDIDTDYNIATAPDRKECVYLGNSWIDTDIGKAGGCTDYNRVGIFPWGKCKQKHENEKGQIEKVVSARAIKHVKELTKLASGEILEADNEKLESGIIFVVGRHDVTGVRPNAAACPVFTRYLKIVKEAGVRVSAHAVRWGEGVDLGVAYYGGEIPVIFPSSD